MTFIKKILAFTLLLISTVSNAGPTDSFSTAKNILMTDVYSDHRVTLYCSAPFDNKNNVITPAGFTTDKYLKRAKRIEWEHVVPAENFGRTFKEWREGHSRCMNSKGKAFKGRNCTSKVNIEYRYMQSDLYNLYPAIGAVNALRSNFNFTMLPNEESDFGSCQMKLANTKAEPPVQARGRIARTYLYMEQRYKRYRMSNSQRKLMTAWDKQYPVSDWECIRAERIRAIQGNANNVVRHQCLNSHISY